MIFPIPSTSDEAYSAITEVGAQLSGQRLSVPLAQVSDDGTLTFPSIDPSEAGDARAKQEATTTKELIGPRVRRQLLMALRRDAQHAHASRGMLLLHGAQTRLLGLYETGNQLGLVFS